MRICQAPGTQFPKKSSFGWATIMTHVTIGLVCLVLTMNILPFATAAEEVPLVTPTGQPQDSSDESGDLHISVLHSRHGVLPHIKIYARLTDVLLIVTIVCIFVIAVTLVWITSVILSQGSPMADSLKTYFANVIPTALGISIFTEVLWIARAVFCIRMHAENPYTFELLKAKHFEYRPAFQWTLGIGVLGMIACLCVFTTHL